MPIYNIYQFHERKGKISKSYCGTFTSYYRATKAIITNQTDLHEDLFKFIIMEKLEDGFNYGIVEMKYYFEWQDNGTFKQITKEEFIKHAEQLRQRE